MVKVLVMMMVEKVVMLVLVVVVVVSPAAPPPSGTSSASPAGANYTCQLVQNNAPKIASLFRQAHLHSFITAIIKLTRGSARPLHEWTKCV